MPFHHHGFFRVAVASPRVVVADPLENTLSIVELLKQAEENSVSLTVFPELCVTGYTCADLFATETLLSTAQYALEQIRAFTVEEYLGVAVLGMPWRIANTLFNVAVVLHRGSILGIVPKSYLPNYREFYEHRWFAPAAKLKQTEVEWNGKHVPVGIDLLFKAKEIPDCIVGVELCEDLWMPVPPSSLQALQGATLLVNPSASTELIGKVNYRRALVCQQSGRCLAAYLYAGSGVTESTTDVIFGGHCLIAEAGTLLVESDRFARDSQLTMADVDLERLTGDRQRQPSFSDAAYYVPGKINSYRTIEFELKPGGWKSGSRLQRMVDPHPFVPHRDLDRDERCAEVFHLQTAGLAKRLEVVGKTPITIGISGGLDSTLALLVACQTLDLLKRDRSQLTGFIMPGFGSSEKTKKLAMDLLSSMGVTARIADIRELCLEEMKQLGHQPFGLDLTGCTVEDLTEQLKDIPKEKRHDLIFENVQARMRTSLLMNAGFVVGTGDLSELALGWCTYNGDHISMYNPNVGVPKTLVRYLIRWVADRYYQNQHLQAVLHQIASQVITPELLPAGPDGQDVQSTEASVGPYELQDFYLYHFLRFGFSPRKIMFLAEQAKFDVDYDAETKKKWLHLFFKRFFANQFKRSCLPDGPKVGSVSLSPRGDWRMPSDASVNAWLEDLKN